MRYAAVSRFSLALALAGALAATPALAQGKGKGHDKEKSRPELVRRESQKRQAEETREAQKRRAEALLRERDDDRRDDRRYDRRDDGRYDRLDGDRRGEVPRGWCQGKGNPHNTPENCGYRAGRSDDGYDHTGDRGRYGSYDEAHRSFHYDHDRQCRMRAAERPLDLPWQIRVRTECKERHDDWHYRAGREHRG